MKTINPIDRDKYTEIETPSFVQMDPEAYMRYIDGLVDKCNQEADKRWGEKYESVGNS